VARAVLIAALRDMRSNRRIPIMKIQELSKMYGAREPEIQPFGEDVFRVLFDLRVNNGRFWAPLVDIFETESDLLIKCEIAGVTPEDLHVTLSADDRVLTIAGMRSEPKDSRSRRRRCHQLEIYYGPFERSITLPEDVAIDRERLSADYKSGFLVVQLPKSGAFSAPIKRKIKVVNSDNISSSAAGGIETSES
jgi:HSP20 family protein